MAHLIMCLFCLRKGIYEKCNKESTVISDGSCHDACIKHDRQCGKYNNQYISGAKPVSEGNAL